MVSSPREAWKLYRRILMRSRGYKKQKLSFERKAVIASASVTSQKNTFHSITEVDISGPRQQFKNEFEETGEKTSLTAYIVHCLVQTIEDHQHLNAFVKSGNLIQLDNVVVSVLVERELKGEKVPEPVAIQAAQTKDLKTIQNEIRHAQKQQSDDLGGLSGSAWIKLIPGFLLRLFVKVADKNISMAKRYGKIGVTATGMFAEQGMWLIPHGSPTVLLTVGSISNRVVEIDGEYQSREFLCLTISFDHDVVDGAPATRFTSQLIETIKNGIPPVE